MRHRLILLALLLTANMVRSENVKLTCWIVGEDGGKAIRTEESIFNLVEEVNGIYKQVCMRFAIDSIFRTNSTYLANVHLTNSVQWTELCSIGRNTDGLELYFVVKLGGEATAFHTRGGIVIGPKANGRSVAHEIGHACGLPDIYEESEDGSLFVSGKPTRERMPDDWGWYPPTVTQEDIVQRLLMYGYQSDAKADISYGDIYGVHYTSSWNRVTREWTDHWMLDLAPVGFRHHGNRHPVSR